jgi:hypothetical protein
MNIVKALVIYQPVAMILAGKPFDLSSLVFQCPAVNAVRHPDVQCSRAAAHDINEIFVILHNNSMNLSS